jgi:hypothetical protein
VEGDGYVVVVDVGWHENLILEVQGFGIRVVLVDNVTRCFNTLVYYISS